MPRSTKNRSAVARKRHGGRPSLLESSRLTEHIIARATTLFLWNGFEATSVDMVVAEASISKRTFYTRFGGKADLFSAVVIRFVEERVARLDAISAAPGKLKNQLEAVSCEILRLASEPAAIALDRVVTAEVGRFPELGRTFHDFAISRAVGPIRTILDQAQRRGEIGPLDTQHAAEHFLFATVMGPMRLVVLGVEGSRLSGPRLERLRRSIQLFIDGLPLRAVSTRRARRGART